MEMEMRWILSPPKDFMRPKHLYTRKGIWQLPLEVSTRTATEIQKMMIYYGE
jgi:hypothetical protein